MFVTFLPRPKSGTGNVGGGESNPASEEQEWVCDGLLDINAVKALAMAELAQSIATPTGILHLQDVRCDCQGYALFYCKPVYGPKKRQVGAWTWDGDTTGGTFNIKASLETVARFQAAGQNARDHKGAIGVKKDGSVEGVNIVIPSTKINCTYRHPLGFVGLQWLYKTADLTGCTNSKPFLQRAPGEVLFLGGRGSDGTDSPASWSYGFAIEKNLANKIIGGITLTKKAGHDYAWLEFEDADDGGVPVSPPIQLNVERVYEKVDLGKELGFGG